MILTPLEITAWGLGAVALLAAVWLLTAYRSRVVRVGATVRRQTASAATGDAVNEGASVVIVAGDDAEALESLLGKLFQQTWSGDVEFVVVNDGKNDDIKDVVTRIKHLQHRSNLFITFTPPGLRNISHRKLAMTLGIKAAKYPLIVLLNEQSRIYSNEWLSRMVAPFADSRIEVVIGSALPAVKFDKGFGARYRSFTHGHDATVWLSSAIGGKPWRAHRANMAFRRQLFFDSGGFNSALNLCDGDDDIFISKVCRKGNSATVCAAQAAVRYSMPDSKMEFHSGRSRRMFTSRNLGRGAARFWGFSSIAAWAMTLCSLGTIALGAWLHDWVIFGICAALLIGTWLGLAFIWRATLKALRCRPTTILAFPMMLRRPLTNAVHRLRSRKNKSEYRTTPS